MDFSGKRSWVFLILLIATLVMTTSILAQNAVANNDGQHDTSFQVGRQSQSNEQPAKVKASIFYEVLCPDSISFIVWQLWPTYGSLQPILDVELVPYGKASYRARRDSWTFDCQHGPRECQGNKIHACVLHLYPNITKSLPFVHCSMSASDTVSASKQCAESNALDWQLISECERGKLGSSLLHANGVKTETLEPRMYFVPWILINNVYNTEIQDQALNNFRSVVCNVYKGTKPDKCLITS